MKSERIFEQVCRDINNLISLGYGMTDFQLSIATSPNQVYNATNPMPKVVFWYFQNSNECLQVYKKVCIHFSLEGRGNLAGQYLYILLASWD